MRLGEKRGAADKRSGRYNFLGRVPADENRDRRHDEKQTKPVVRPGQRRSVKEREEEKRAEDRQGWFHHLARDAEADQA